MSETSDEPRSQTSEETTDDASGRKTILIVDDDPDIVFALAALLQDTGYAVIATDNADRLLEPNRGGELPDLILLDMLLSGRDGREITAQLKEQPATRHIPVLMLSAHPTGEHEAEAAGADGFLAKPFDVEELLARIALYLR